MQNGKIENTAPLVAVWMVTYNHSRYIRQAVESIMVQKTSFNYLLVIGEDHSSDDTLEICKTLKEKYGDRIRLISNQKNLGGMYNAYNIYNSCFDSGARYIALCEGDDYWTDPYKLQKQVDIMEKNPDCKMVFTDASVLDEITGELTGNWASVAKNQYRFKDLVKRNIVTTCTVLFRRPGKTEPLIEWISHFKVGDYPLYLYVLRKGYALFLDEVTAVYRQHSGGMFSSKIPGQIITTNIEILQTLCTMKLSLRENFYVRKSLVNWYYAKVVRLSNDGRSDEIRSVVKHDVRLSDLMYNTFYFLKILFVYMFPKSKQGVFQTS